MPIDHTNTPDEVIDLIDENDRVIGETTKGKANSNPLLIHREVEIFLIDDENRLLFQQRSRKKTVKPLHWICSVAGHIPKGMDPLTGAHKELVEELGFDTDLTFIGKELYRYRSETHFSYWYLGTYKGETIVPDPSEIEQVAFLTPKALKYMLKKKLPFNPYYVKMAEKIWKKI